jgi:hypothetical protein
MALKGKGNQRSKLPNPCMKDNPGVGIRRKKYGQGGALVKNRNMARAAMLLAAVALSAALWACQGEGKQDQGSKAPAGLNQAPTAPAPAPVQAPEVGKGPALRLIKFSCVDAKGMKSEAFSFLMPADWQFKGGIVWRLDNPIMPAMARFTVKSPDGSTALEVFPNQSLFWTTNPMHRSIFPAGSKYFGAEVRPVASPEQALKGIVIPRFRGGGQNLKVISVKAVPELAKKLGAGKPQPGVDTFGDAARVRIEYVRDGVAMEEEIFAAVEGFSFPIQTMQGVVKNTNWFVDYIFSFKAPKGKLDGNTALFKTMVTSFQVNPGWFSRYNQVVDHLIKAQIRQIHSVGELSRIIAKTSEERSAATMQQYERKQDAYDRVAETFSEYTRNTEHYHNPFEEKEVELPSGYSHVWTNTSGEYVFSDSPSYNPNVGSNKNWEELKAK